MEFGLWARHRDPGKQDELPFSCTSLSPRVDGADASGLVLNARNAHEHAFFDRMTGRSGKLVLGGSLGLELQFQLWGFSAGDGVGCFRDLDGARTTVHNPIDD